MWGLDSMPGQVKVRQRWDYFPMICILDRDITEISTANYVAITVNSSPGQQGEKYDGPIFMCTAKQFVRADDRRSSYRREKHQANEIGNGDELHIGLTQNMLTFRGTVASMLVGDESNSRNVP